MRTTATRPLSRLARDDATHRASQATLSRKGRGTSAAGLIIVGLLSIASAQAQDIARGRELFEPCRACHAREIGKTGMAGPELTGLNGRRIASATGFDYSPAMRRGFNSGAVWDEARLMNFLADPDEMFPGLWMSAQPMRDEDARRALARFLLSAEK